MIKIPKKSQYGLRAMVYLAKSFKKKKVCSTKTISLKEGIPFDFLEKIISKLEKAGLVKGKKGALGGYALSRAPGKITAGDIVKVLEEKTAPVDCCLCERSNTCATKSVWKKIQISINKTLDSVTLADLIK